MKVKMMKIAVQIGENFNLNKTQRYKMNMPYIPKDVQLWK